MSCDFSHGQRAGDAEDCCATKDHLTSLEMRHAYDPVPGVQIKIGANLQKLDPPSTTARDPNDDDPLAQALLKSSLPTSGACSPCPFEFDGSFRQRGIPDMQMSDMIR